MQNFKNLRKTLESKAKPSKLNRFNNKILILGFGSVGQAILPLILKHIDINESDITVLEKGENKKRFDQYHGDSKVNYVKLEVTRDNLDKTLSKYIGDNGFLIDVSVGIDCQELLTYCFTHNTNYINTSLERWIDKEDEDIPNLADRTLYSTHKRIRKFARPYGSSATATVVSGANPGLVTHLTKEALLLIAKKEGKPVEAPNDKEGWAQLMKSLGVEVIQIAERDTQSSMEPKEPNQFKNTWSCIGMTDEGRAPSELGFGTHEPLEQEDLVVQDTAAYLKRPGVSVLVKSWVPSFGAFNGYLIQHSESVTMSQYFETKDKSFRPTVYYAYQPTDYTLASLHEFRGRELDVQVKTTIMKDELIEGKDELGVLLITNKGKSYWYGSILDINEARKLIPGENATSVQVVANMIGTISWALNNPNLGYVEPEDMDYNYILDIAKPYLCKLVFAETDWRPEIDKTDLFPRKIDEKHLNSLSNFRVWSGTI